MAASFPKAKMGQDLPDNPIVLDKGDDPHLRMAFGAQQRINPINFLYKPHPLL
jgi:hypothetical protein